jgi:hypothetical protein
MASFSLTYEDEYISELEDNFKKVFETIFEALLERIFTNNVNMVTREKFIETIDGNPVEKARELIEKQARAAMERF